MAEEYGPFEKSAEGKEQRETYLCTFSMLAKLVSSDGEVSKSEIVAVDSFMKQVLKLTPERREFSIKAFNAARKSPETFQHYVERYKKILSHKPEMYEWLLDVLLRISLIDRVFSPNEVELLEEARAILGVPEEKFREIKSRYLKGGDREKHLAVLGLSTASSLDDIQARFGKLSQDYNPDRVLACGLPDEFVELARKRVTEFRAAFSALTKDESN